jgi:hypothetical protein
MLSTAAGSGRERVADEFSAGAAFEDHLLHLADSPGDPAAGTDLGRKYSRR